MLPTDSSILTALKSRFMQVNPKIKSPFSLTATVLVSWVIATPLLLHLGMLIPIARSKAVYGIPNHQ